MNPVERPTRHATRADIGTGQPQAQNAAAVNLDGRDSLVHPFLDPDSVVDLAVDADTTDTDDLWAVRAFAGRNNTYLEEENAER